MATTAQIDAYALHKELCDFLGVPQSTLHHKSLQGTLSPPSPTGNVVYTGASATTTGPVTTDTLVWLATQPKNARSGGSGDETPIGRQGIPNMIAQIPAIDDNEDLVVIAHDDLITDASGTRYRISDPAPTPEYGTWVFSMRMER